MLKRKIQLQGSGSAITKKDGDGAEGGGGGGGGVADLFPGTPLHIELADFYDNLVSGIKDRNLEPLQEVVNAQPKWHVVTAKRSMYRDPKPLLVCFIESTPDLVLNQILGCITIPRDFCALRRSCAFFLELCNDYLRVKVKKERYTSSVTCSADQKEAFYIMDWEGNHVIDKDVTECENEENSENNSNSNKLCKLHCKSVDEAAGPPSWLRVPIEDSGWNTFVHKKTSQYLDVSDMAEGPGVAATVSPNNKQRWRLTETCHLENELGLVLEVSDDDEGFCFVTTKDYNNTKQNFRFSPTIATKNGLSQLKNLLVL